MKARRDRLGSVQLSLVARCRGVCGGGRGTWYARRENRKLVVSPVSASHHGNSHVEKCRKEGKEEKKKQKDKKKRKTKKEEAKSGETGLGCTGGEVCGIYIRRPHGQTAQRRTAGGRDWENGGRVRGRGSIGGEASTADAVATAQGKKNRKRTFKIKKNIKTSRGTDLRTGATQGKQVPL